jgi:predicted RNA binding protein YcfA (HicA-like mRNA interferase family)
MRSKRRHASGQFGCGFAPVIVALAMILAVAFPMCARAAVAPVLARSVVVLRVSGVVRVEASGSHAFLLLSGARKVIPVHSTVDTTRGKVELVTADSTHGKAQYGYFDGGAFVVTQDRSGLATLGLVGGRSMRALCRRRPAAARAAAAASGVLRLLRASAHGKFRTRGHYAAATVLGTQWTTSDTCQGTSIGDRTGPVATQTNNGSLSNSLRPGQQVLYRCAVHGQRPVSRVYCVVVLLTSLTSVIGGRRVRRFEFSTALGTKSPNATARLCVEGPRRRFCTPYPLVAGTSGFRIALALCLPTQGPGAYSISWELRSIALGAPLTFRAPIGEAFTPCHTLQGNPLVGPSLGSLTSDVKIVNHYSLPTVAHGLDIRIFLLPTATPGQQALKGVVYADANGVPGGLLGVTDELTYRSSEGPGWYYLYFPRHPTQTNPSGLLPLRPGSYWIGVIGGDQSGVAQVTYDPVPGADDENTNPYLTGPSDPFGPIVAGDERLSLYLDYFAPPF